MLWRDRMLERTGCVLSRDPINPITLVITAFTTAGEQLSASLVIPSRIIIYHGLIFSFLPWEGRKENKSISCPLPVSPNEL